MNLKARKCRGVLSGFTLTEVVIAIGVAAFSLVSVIALLPAGLESVKNAEEEAAAAATIEQIAGAIWNATTAAPVAVPVAVPNPPGAAYRATGAYSDLEWTVGGGAVVTRNYTDLSFGGESTTETLAQRLIARVEIDPPADFDTPGSALISVAWTHSAQWNSSTQNWDNAQGAVTSRILFLPRK